ncbi:MAG: hypothetical protein Q4C98_06375 [Capnocytophaga sp.]|nr:hypothetical protein [Capnocytophaga sp.]
MKKTLFLSVLALGSLTAFAQDKEADVKKATNVVAVQDEYTEIEKGKLPKAVVESFAKIHQGATINKAFVNAKGEYKIEATNSKGEAIVANFDKDGNSLEK